MQINLEVVKSYKVEGSVAIREPGRKWTVRKMFLTNKEGRPAFRYKNVDYTFEWDASGQVAINIGPLKNHEARNIVNQIKDEAATKAVKVEVPKVGEVKATENTDKNVKHEQYSKILTCVSENIPVYLYGPAGSGKNFTLQQAADELSLDFYFTNSVQQEFKLTGFIDAGGKYHSTEFRKAFEFGGLFFLDEMDASIPEVLVLLNAAIANRYFEFPDGKVNAHQDFRVVAAGNTVGNGADEQYTGRLELDQATLDRFVLIEFGYSKRIELALAKGNTSLVEFIHNLRKQAEEQGIRATFSYRAIITTVKLEGKLELREIIQIAIMKGFDKDTVNTFKADSTKYGRALQSLQQGA